MTFVYDRTRAKNQLKQHITLEKICVHIVELVHYLKHKIGGQETLLRVETAKYFVSLQCVLSTFPSHIYTNKLYLSIKLTCAKSNGLYDYDHCLQALQNNYMILF